MTISRTEADPLPAPGSQSDEARHVRRVTVTGLLINILLAAVKLGAGLLGHSRAVVADAVHSLSDAGTDTAILIGVRYWSAPADPGHPHGHRRIETLVTLSIALVLGAVAVGLAYSALGTLQDEHAVAPTWLPFWVAAAAVLVKEALYRWSVGVGRRIRSSALIANAWHHRSDGLSSIPAALAVAGAKLNPSWAFLDHVGAVVVSLIILQAVLRIGWPALRELVDASAPEGVRRRIGNVAQVVDGVQAVHAVRTRYMGSGIQVDLHVLVDGAMSVRDGHRASEAVKRRLIEEGLGIIDVVVHLESADDADQASVQF